MWRRMMVQLGLGDEAEYDDYDNAYDDEADRHGGQPRHPAPHVRPEAPASPVSAYPDEPSAIGAVRPISSRTGEAVTPGSSAGGTAVPRPRPQVVRPVAVNPNAKPHVVVPTSFNQAQEVADTLKGSQPVIMNLQGSDRDLARRLIDFASGLCYGIGGQMERVANQVYLLTPTNVEVSAEERRRLHERGYDS